MYRHSPRTVQIRSRDSQGIRRFKNLALLVLLAAVIILTVALINSGTYQSNARALYAQRARNELNSAISLCNTLSRTGGSGSASALGEIRAHIYAIDTLNTVASALSGGRDRMLDAYWFTTIYGEIDAYMTTLSTGMNTSTNQTDLKSMLESMSLALGYD